MDGDTVHVRLDLGCDVRIDLTLRLAGINAPEMSTLEGRAAKAWLMDHLPDKVLVRTRKDKREKYGRYLATLILLDDADTDLNVAMMQAGHAVPYEGGLRT